MNNNASPSPEYFTIPDFLSMQYRFETTQGILEFKYCHQTHIGFLIPLYFFISASCFFPSI